MAGFICGEIDKLGDNNLVLGDDFCKRLFLKCVDLWLKGHSLSNAMTMGTTTEVPTFNKFFDEHSLKRICEVGLFQHNSHLFLGVSSNVILILNGGDYDGQIGCAEIKTRCARSNIQQVEKALQYFGRTL